MAGKVATRNALFNLTFDHFLLFLWNYLISRQILPKIFEIIGQQLLVKFKSSCSEARDTRSEERVSALGVSSKHVAVSWLRGLLIVDHLILETDENFLHGVLWVPVLEHMESLFNFAVLLVHTWQVDFGAELNLWSNHWVAIAAGDNNHVDSVVEVSVWWANDGTVPVCERLIVT